MNRARASLVFFALTVPFGIAVHLASEFASLGRDAEDIAFAPIHAYLGLLAVIAAISFAYAAAIFNSHERRRRLALVAAALPFHGRGAAFLALSAAAQFGFFLLTQLREGCPFCSGDVAYGIIGALLASVAGAFVLAALRIRFANGAACSCAFCSRKRSAVSPIHRIELADLVALQPLVRYAFAFAVRPPPAFLLAQP